jgi:hypothetical protein
MSTPAIPTAPLPKTVDQLRQQMATIQARCEGWKSCQDGSYECALDAAGYYRLCDELEALLAKEAA